jgi:hypothetical protein
MVKKLYLRFEHSASNVELVVSTIATMSWNLVSDIVTMSVLQVLITSSVGLAAA